MIVRCAIKKLAGRFSERETSSALGRLHPSRHMGDTVSLSHTTSDERGGLEICIHQETPS